MESLSSYAWSFLCKIGSMISLASIGRNSLHAIGGDRALLLARFIRKIPALWREELCADQHRNKDWSPNRIFVAGDDAYFPIYCPEVLDSPEGGFLRTYNVFRHQANAWYMRREVRNFIRYALTARRFADVGSAEGFYSALFASMHGRDAEILSIDCGSIAGCNSAHSRIVRDQNASVFRPARWDYLQAFVTDARLLKPAFHLPAETSVVTLSALLNGAHFAPDLIKFDIESSEYEVLLDSLGFFEACRPTLIIEVHNSILVERGLSFLPVVKKLRDINYEVVACDVADYLHAGNCHVVMQCFK
jgi:hypothetical protein